jgi:hypothetical protein
MIEYYSARANPYYLIYVNKLNLLYQTYFVEQKDKAIKRKSSFDAGTGAQFDSDTVSKQEHQKNLAKSLSAGY